MNECSSDDRSQSVGEQEAASVVLSIRSWSRKDLPKAKGFIASTSDNGGTIGGHCQVKDTVRVSSESH